MQQRAKSFIAKTLVTALIYSALLLPFQISLPLFAGTDIRPSAFLPIVLGIFWGMPAAVGVFIGNLCCDLCCIQSPLVLLGSFLNGVSAICARRIFFAAWNHSITKGEYIYSFGTLLNFLITTVCVELALCLPISVMVHYYSGSPVLSAFPLIFLNNMHSNIIFGIPAMLFLPVINKWAVEPEGKGGIKGNVIALCFILSSVLLTLPFILAEPNQAWSVILIIPLLGAAYSASPTPTVEKNQALFGFQSIRHKTFRQLMNVAIVISIAISLIFYLGFTESKGMALFTEMYHLFAYIDILFLILFAYSYQIIEKHLLTPIRGLASKLSLDGEKYDNELDIISKRMDFVVSGNSSFLSSDEYSIIVGLSSKDYSKKFSVLEAREIINGICLKHVGGYISTKEAEGGYKGNETVGSEQILIYTIYGASDTQIRAISDDILAELNQESVLIEKNKLTRYYYYGA